MSNLPRTGTICLLTITLRLNGAVAADDINFDQAVAPILAAHCIECHSGPAPKGGLGLTSGELMKKGGDSGAAVLLQDPENSPLWQRVRDDEMPPKHPLQEADKAILQSWIAAGAKWGKSPIDPFAVTTGSRAGRDWWALQPLQTVEIPQLDAADWGRNEIDAFVLQQLQQRGLSPSPEAEPRVLLRRLFFDLIGLPPSPEQVERFLADPSDKAWQETVEQLLGSAHYGERWARHWLDVVRFGESDGFERNNARRNAWPFRDWVVSALNEDMPYDRFVEMQLIGDLLDDGPAGAAAAGFWVAGVHNTVVGGSKRMKQLAREDEIEEVLATVGQTFLGLTTNCARCHDHKFDPVTQKEYYQLASAISGLGYGERVVKSDDDAAELKRIQATLRKLQQELATIDAAARRRILAARKAGTADIPDPPAAFARWEFDGDLRDSLGSLHGTPHGDVQFADGAVVVNGSAFVETSPLPKPIAEKTLEAWVQLDSDEQRGGGVITIETRNGVVFDSIVFGERDPGQWMAGSNGFVRTDSFQAPRDSEIKSHPVHVALVYTADGTITGYRDGKPYGRPIRKAPLQTYAAGDTDVIFGLRHKPPGGNRFLTGRIYSAALYDRALSPEEVAACSGHAAEYVPEKQIVASLPDAERQHRQQLKRQIEDVTKTRDALTEKASRTIYTLTAGPGKVTNVLLRGDPDNIGEVVAAGGVAAVPGLTADFGLPPDAPEAERRRKLSDWITDSSNPLFSRVLVNRLWHYHFGTGLIDTPNDFGFNGGRPSHPLLLDWLAVRFRDGGFRMKDIHRLIVNSATYRQAGYRRAADSATELASNADPALVDAGNRLLWRMTPRRLEAESVRDAMLAVSGQLNRRSGGPSFEDVSVIYNSGTTYYEPLDVDGPEYFRRTLYRFNPRGGRSALLDTLDCPDPAAAAPRRAVTTTPLQALSLLNNAFVLRMSDYCASRVASEAGDNVPEQINRVWQLAVGRDPTKSEMNLSQQLVAQFGLPALCRGIFNISEFVIIE